MFMPNPDRNIMDDFRRWGYLQAKLDPLAQYSAARTVPELDTSGPVADKARQLYCGTIGLEFMHIADHAKRRWIQERFENVESALDRPRILDSLVRADIFEQLLQTRYPGAKRFSLEGTTVLIPALETMLHRAAECGAKQAVLAMSHRGRLNVMANVMGISPAAIFAKFEDLDPRSVLGSGDVKYHLGATGRWKDADGKTIDLHLVSNPSHLEAVDPVAMGRARAKQTRIGSQGYTHVLPILIHGDAAVAGQGICAEALNLASVNGFAVGGSIHLIVNNLIGFTAGPDESNSSLFASDVMKGPDIPIFHVNAEDPDAAVRVAKIAVDYRSGFESDVVVDLIGYRRYGHSEIDDPTVTQPLRYARIKGHPPLYRIYADQTGVNASAQVEEIRSALAKDQAAAAAMKKSPALAVLPAYWSAYHGGCYDAKDEVITGISADRIREIGQRASRSAWRTKIIVAPYICQ